MRPADEIPVMVLLIVDFLSGQRMQCDEFHVTIHMDVVIVNLQGNAFANVFRRYGILLSAVAEEAGVVYADFMIDQLIRISDGLLR